MTNTKERYNKLLSHGWKMEVKDYLSELKWLQEQCSHDFIFDGKNNIYRCDNCGKIKR